MVNINKIFNILWILITLVSLSCIENSNGVRDCSKLKEYLDHFRELCIQEFEYLRSNHEMYQMKMKERIEFGSRIEKFYCPTDIIREYGPKTENKVNLPDNSLFIIDPRTHLTAAETLFGWTRSNGELIPPVPNKETRFRLDPYLVQLKYDESPTFSNADSTKAVIDTPNMQPLEKSPKDNRINTQESNQAPVVVELRRQNKDIDHFRELCIQEFEYLRSNHEMYQMKMKERIEFGSKIKKFYCPTDIIREYGPKTENKVNLPDNSLFIIDPRTHLTAAETLFGWTRSNGELIPPGSNNNKKPRFSIDPELSRPIEDGSPTISGVDLTKTAIVTPNMPPFERSQKDNRINTQESNQAPVIVTTTHKWNQYLEMEFAGIAQKFTKLCEFEKIAKIDYHKIPVGLRGTKGAQDLLDEYKKLVKERNLFGKLLGKESCNVEIGDDRSSSSSSSQPGNSSMHSNEKSGKLCYGRVLSNCFGSNGK